VSDSRYAPTFLVSGFERTPWAECGQLDGFGATR